MFLLSVTPCTASPCIHGYCNITYAGYKCTCDAISFGVNCEGKYKNPTYLYYILFMLTYLFNKLNERE